MSRGLTVSDLRDAPLERIAREVEDRVASILAPHRIGDEWPTVTPNDYARLAGLVLRLIEKIEKQEARKP